MWWGVQRQVVCERRSSTAFMGVQNFGTGGLCRDQAEGPHRDNLEMWNGVIVI
ncbi:MAG: hypothetical protein CM1200mP18_04900 [Gammaproteobacteria bacterium]|nr:MAG: hypothetical protein CM1200mP18_04900 [Gammaproteobacteria bacterium]